MNKVFPRDGKKQRRKQARARRGWALDGWRWIHIGGGIVYPSGGRFIARYTPRCGWFCGFFSSHACNRLRDAQRVVEQRGPVAWQDQRFIARQYRRHGFK